MQQRCWDALWLWGKFQPSRDHSLDEGRRRIAAEEEHLKKLQLKSYYIKKQPKARAKFASNVGNSGDLGHMCYMSKKKASIEQRCKSLVKWLPAAVREKGGFKNFIKMKNERKIWKVVE